MAGASAWLSSCCSLARSRRNPLGPHRPLQRLTAPATGAAGARRALPKQVKGGAIAGAIGGAILITPFMFVDDETAGTKVGAALGAIAVGAAIGARVGLLISSL